MTQRFIAQVVDPETVKVAVHVTMTIAEWMRLRDGIQPSANLATQNFFYMIRDVIDLVDVQIKKVVENE